MRETDWEVLQAPDGHLPHRVLLPVDGPQLHTAPMIGGPDRPALDGMLGTILKTYREVRQGADRAWLDRYLPHARRLMDYVRRTWDTGGTGVLSGDQPVTHDISLTGPNMFTGGLWLAALRAMQEMTARAGAPGETDGFARRFREASAHYDELLWNGEYYSQKEQGDAFDFGDGCLADQLFGQWWAHQLDLGHILPAEHVRTALAAIVRHNLRVGFRGFEHGYRVFADGDDEGLLVCTWPRGGRPSVPIRYADEVWTGTEYQVAAHCLFEGMKKEGMRLLCAVRRRYDGSRRNPYNEIECGDHYARAMAGFSVLEAYTGASYDAWAGHLRIGRGAERLRLARGVERYPLLAGTGWGEVENRAHEARVTILGGEVRLAQMSVQAGEITGVQVAGEPLPCDPGAVPGQARLAVPLTLPEGSAVTVKLKKP
jgi:hypothetical protein